jgi:predicted permease
MRPKHWLHTIPLRLRSLFRRAQADQELDDELRDHLERKTEEYVAQGMTQEEAHRRARLDLGGIEQTKEKCRDARRVNWIQDLLQDLRFGLRMLRNSPGFTTVAVFTLALGIGANTAIFSVLDAVMLRPLPVRNPSRLVLLGWRASARYRPNLRMLKFYGACSMEGFGVGPQGHVESAIYSSCSFSEPFFHEIERANIFSGVGAFVDLGTMYLSGIGSATTVDAEAVSGSFFNVMGIRVAAGRLLGPADDTPSAAPVAVLSYGYWQSAFGGSRDAIGRVIDLKGLPLTIIGVAEPGFTGITPGSNFELWVPLSDYARVMGWPPGRRQDDPREWLLTIIGRLKLGERRAQAQAAVSGLFGNQFLHGGTPLFTDTESGRTPSGGSRASAPSIGEPELTITPAQTGLMGYRGLYANPLYVLMFAIGIVLVVACANVAGLLLARASARRKEMAVRLALGAGRARVVRQLLTESVTLSLLGGALGVLFAYVGAHAVASFVGNVQLMAVGSADPIRLRILGFTSVDPRILGFAFALMLLTGILFGLVPAFRNTRVDLTPALKEGAQSATNSARDGGKSLTLGNGLVVGQVALAVVLLAGAGLLVRTLSNLRDVNLGFDTHHVLSFGVWAPPRLNGRQWEVLNQELQRRLAEMPGVRSASDTSWPLLMGVIGSTDFHWPGTPTNEQSEADELKVGPNFFPTMRIPLLAGRVFSATDFEVAATEEGTKPSQPPVPVIVNQKFVEQFVGKENPLDVRFGEHGPTADGPASPGYEIVGVVGNARLSGPRQRIRPLIYEPSRGSFFQVRTVADPRSIVPAVRKIVAEADPDIAVFDVTTESVQIDQLLFRERLMARLSGFFGLLAMALACIGLYGLLSYETSQRTHEIGIRMALGAEHQDVLRLILGRGITLAVIGAATGIGGALALTRFLRSLLFEIRPTDPATFAGVAILLLIVGLAACYIPTRRAMKVDPMVALRYE